MKKKAIYDEQPQTIRYKGHQYVLAAEGEEAPPPEEPEEEKPNKRKSTRAARIRIDDCTGQSVIFTIKAVVRSYNDLDIPGIDTDDGVVSARNFKIKRLSTREPRSGTRVDGLPKDVIELIEKEPEGEAVLAAIQKQAAIRPRSPLYYIEATGGWDWTKANGDKGVRQIHGLLRFLKGQRAALFSYCHNKINYGGKTGLL
jgi:hypothetical protein